MGLTLGISTEATIDSPKERERDDETTITLPRERFCAAQARRFVCERLGAHASDVALENAVLVASELVTNAYAHGEGAIELRLDMSIDRVRIEVLDQGTRGKLALRDPTHDQPGGWGLQIVDQLANEWGVVGDAAHIWAKLPIR